MDTTIFIYSTLITDEIPLRNISKEDLKIFWNDIARGSDIFGGWTNGCIHLNNTSKTREHLNKIQEKYSRKIPSIKRLYSCSNRLKDGDFIYIINKNEAVIAEIMSALAVLQSGYKNYLQWVTVHNQIFDIWSRISFEYDVFVLGNDSIIHKIGEPNKKLRKCRFCTNTGKKFFAHASHAIPEAIGNKTLFCNEECDECNSRLRDIEENFTRLMDFRRAMLELGRKDSTECPIIKGENYSIAPSDDGTPTLYIKQSAKPVKTIGGGQVVYKFHHYEYVVNQDIYRALAKIVIDLIPDDKLLHFSETIKWINRDHQELIPDALPPLLYGSLPPVGLFKQPMICIFFRKNEREDIPYCTAVLFTGDIAYQYVLPFVDIDNGKYRYSEELAYARTKLNKYFNIKWTEQEFFSWWPSFIWNYWPIDRSSKYVKFLPDNDSHFKPERTFNKKVDKLFRDNIFDYKDIKDSKLNRLTVFCQNIPVIFGTFPVQGIKKLLFRLDLANNQVRTEIQLVLVISEKLYNIDAAIDCDIRNLKRLYSTNKYITGGIFESLAFHLSDNTMVILRKSIKDIAVTMKIQSLRTTMLFQQIKKAKFELIIPNGKVIKTSFHSLVE